MADDKDYSPRSALGQLIAYVDVPWKIAAVLVLGMAGIAGWSLYQRRDEIIDAWVIPAAVTLNTAGVAAALDRLIDDSGANLVQIWSVDLSINAQRYIGGRRGDGERVVAPSPRRIPAITPQSDIQILVNKITGLATCVDTAGRSSVVIRIFTDQGMSRVCAVPIPPSPDALVGVIYLAWRERPASTTEDIAVSAAREIATRLAQKRWQPGGLP